MTFAITASARKHTPYRGANPGGMSLEAEIRSLCTLEPENVRQLPLLFADSVVESCTTIAGMSTGEALIRRIGDGMLQDPEEVYGRIDTLLQGGSSTLRKAIEQRFRSKVHRLYRVSINLESRAPTAL